MTNELIADKESLQEAYQYKAELLAGMFGIAAHAATATGTATVKARGLLSNVPWSSNVVGIGYGAKLTGGASIQETAVRVYVRAKLPRSLLSKSAAVPPDINGKPTDVIPVGDIIAVARPTACGVSIGHPAVTAGTLGCLVKREGNNDDRYILSNNHVLANVNNAQIGDAILEPGLLDGGDVGNPIAELADFEPLVNGTNLMDAAIARLINPSHVTANILVIDFIKQPSMLGVVYQSVRKHGRTTQHTVGVIMDIAADIRVGYGTKVFEFADQLGIVGISGGPFADRGDSGSLIVDAVSRRPVALLFAVGIGTTFANPIDGILERFRVEIITNEE